MKKKTLIAIIAIVSFAVTGCNNGSTGGTTQQPKPPTPKPQVTAKITVPAITAVANPMDFGAVSAYTGWDTNFPAADVTYTLSVDGTSLAAGTTTVSASGYSAGAHTITQTFYYNGKVVDTRNGTVVTSGGGTWGIISESFSNITLSLSKDAL